MNICLRPVLSHTEYQQEGLWPVKILIQQSQRFSFGVLLGGQPNWKDSQLISNQKSSLRVTEVLNALCTSVVIPACAAIQIETVYFSIGYRKAVN